MISVVVLKEEQIGYSFRGRGTLSLVVVELAIVVASCLESGVVSASRIGD